MVALRLARREFYEAIGSIAASAQRSRAEPERVQLPLPAMATLLTRQELRDVIEFLGTLK